jgi:hypothetical protein
MSRAGKFVVVASVVWLLASEAIAAHRTTALVFLGMFIDLCFLGVAVFGLVHAISEWRQRRWRAVLPLAACGLAVAVSVPCGRMISRAMFDWALPSYEAVVRQVESGVIPASSEFSELPQAEQQVRLAYGVFAQKDSNRVVRVIFFTESGFPALHSGYLYSSSGEPGLGIESRWPTVEKIRNNWFYISN